MNEVIQRIEIKISELEKEMQDTNNELVYTKCKYYIQAYKELIDEFRRSN
jgi:uncharacterized protein YaaR (DUF327 family)